MLDRDERLRPLPFGALMMQKVFEASYSMGVMILISGPTIIVSPSLVMTTGHAAKNIGADDTGHAGAQA